MIQNESETDRTVRVILGTLLVLISYSVMKGAWQVVLYVLGAILLITGFTGFCLIYKLMGISSQK